MSSASRYYEWFRRLAGISPLVLAGAVAWLLWACLPLVRAPEYAPASSAPEPQWPAALSLRTVDWNIFHNRSGTVPRGQGSLAQRFRLAGTFFEFGGTGDKRKAILDERKNGAQHILSENDVLDDVSVVRIFRDRVILRHGGDEEELWLEFARGSAGDPGSVLPDTTGDGTAGALDWLGGKIVGDDRWVFQRDKLIEYYTGLMNEPERLVAVFDSLKPLYSDAGGITGYQLGIEGEEKFFKAIGMQQGDVVRNVNSMQMTSRRRAEYFIREFVADRANAFVLDVERGGKQRKLIYEVR